jgi:predicted nucleic acid-binding Zn ribbon protein
VVKNKEKWFCSNNKKQHQKEKIRKKNMNLFVTKMYVFVLNMLVMILLSVIIPECDNPDRQRRRRRGKEEKIEAGAKRSLRASPGSLRAKMSLPRPSADVS